MEQGLRLSWHFIYVYRYHFFRYVHVKSWKFYNTNQKQSCCKQSVANMCQHRLLILRSRDLSIPGELFKFFFFLGGGGGGGVGHAGNLQRTLRPDVLSKLACKGEDQACHPGCGEKAWPEEGLFCVDLGAEGGEDASCSADTGLQAGVELRG